MVDIQSPTAEIRRGKKRRKKKEERRRNRMKIYMVSLLHRATIINARATILLNTLFSSVYSVIFYIEKLTEGKVTD